MPGNNKTRSAKRAPRAMSRKAKPKKLQPKYELTKPMKDLVHREINSSDQTHEKILQNPSTTPQHLPNVPSSTSYLFNLMPRIVQAGDTASTPSNRETRVGSQVRLSSFNIKGRTFIDVNDGAIEPDRACITCRLLVMSCKKYPVFTDVNANWATGDMLRDKFLKLGSEENPFDGYQFGLDIPVNHDLFTVHHEKHFVLNRGNIQSRSYGGVPVTEGYGSAHMPFVYKYFNFNLKVKNKILKFSDETSVSPTNYAPFAILCWAYTNGAAPSIVQVPKIQFTTKLRWKNM